MKTSDELLAEYGLQRGELRRWKNVSNIPDEKRGRTLLVIEAVDQTHIYSQAGYRVERDNVVRASILEEDGRLVDANNEFDGWAANFVRKYSLRVRSPEEEGP